jgi:phage tail sheath protein FI
MPEYLAPGVYTEEISTGPVPIEGVSTSTAGFVGLTERGPTTVRLVTSLRDFQRWYGGPLEPSTPTGSYLPFAVKGFFDNGGQRLFVARVTGANAAASNVPLPAPQGDALLLEAIGPGNLDDRMFVRVLPGTQLRQAALAAPPTPDPTRFRLQVMYFSTPPPVIPPVDPFDPGELRNPDRRVPDEFEDWDNLTSDPLSGDYVVTALRNSQLVTVAQDTTPGQPAAAAWTAMANGADGDDVTAVEFTGTELPPSGLNALRQVDEISLLCVPDEVNGRLPQQVRDEIRNQLVMQCEDLKDRFAVLQVDQGEGRVDTILPPATTSYAAIYYPWLRVLDSRTNDTVLVPPGGHVVGIYARTDIERGVHKAPANVEVRGMMTRDLPGNRKPLEFLVNKRQHDILNPRGVNVVRDFRADRRGIRVWGARTMSADAQWKYVNVRRLFIFVEESIDEGVQWVVFEPNSEPTWDRVRRSISNFLDSVWRSGALMGSLPEEAFYVRCDRSTMTQQEIDTGQLVCYIGMAPVKPAEFVVLRYSQKTADAES